VAEAGKKAPPLAGGGAASKKPNKLKPFVKNFIRLRLGKS
jgi:hypothetical protein